MNVIKVKKKFVYRPEKLSKLTVIPGWLKIKVEPIMDIPESAYLNRSSRKFYFLDPCIMTSLQCILKYFRTKGL